MSTRGNISIKIPTEMIGKVYENVHGYQVCLEKEYMTIYNHYDSYVDGVGQILLDYYNTFEEAFGLILGGDTSTVQETLSECEYYARQEGWGSSVKPVFTSTPPKKAEEYLYIFENGRWYVYGYSENGPLENYITPSLFPEVKGEDTISLPKNFCYYLHGYLSGLSSSKQDKALDSIIKTLEGYLDV